MGRRSGWSRQKTRWEQQNSRPSPGTAGTHYCPVYHIPTSVLWTHKPGPMCKTILTDLQCSYRPIQQNRNWQVEVSFPFWKYKTRSWRISQPVRFDISDEFQRFRCLISTFWFAQFAYLFFPHPPLSSLVPFALIFITYLLLYTKLFFPFYTFKYLFHSCLLYLLVFIPWRTFNTQQRVTELDLLFWIKHTGNFLKLSSNNNVRKIEFSLLNRDYHTRFYSRTIVCISVNSVGYESNVDRKQCFFL